MTSLSLFDLAAEYRDAATKLADLDLPEEVVRDTLESLSGDLETKAKNTAAIVRNLEASAAAIKEAEQAMAARRKALEARAERIRSYLLSGMQLAGIQRVTCPWFDIAVKDCPPHVVIDAESQIPWQYWRQPEPPPPQLDKRAILADIKAGVEVPGVHSEKAQRLEIR